MNGQKHSVQEGNIFDYPDTRHNLLVDLLTTLKLQNYRFITVTPRTHEHFISKINTSGNDLRDIFGWNLPFAIDVLSPMLKRVLTEANIIEPCGKLFRSRLRISSLHNDLFLHSAFPTSDLDAVFFGPDTYRFTRFIRQSLHKDQQLLSGINPHFQKPIRLLDIGCGTGAGAIAAIRSLPQGQRYEITMNDVNAAALDLTKVNAQVAGIPITLLKGDVFETIDGKFDLIIINPPYMNDESGRSYRDGGAHLGLDFSIRIFKTALAHLAPGGKLFLYTGVAMTDQSDPFLAAVAPLLAVTNCTWSYEEIDPDIFGEELELPAYANAHRIAAVGLVVLRH